jgi:ferredoxin-NADP reductase
LLLLGGGSGVVPLMSMIRHRAACRAALPVLLLYSARAWDEIIFRDELLALDAQGDGFELALALTREPTRRQGDFGRRVDVAMLSDLLARLPQAPKQVFVCGSNPFVEAAAQGTIKAGIPARLIRTERYGG